MTYFMGVRVRNAINEEPIIREAHAIGHVTQTIRATTDIITVTGCVDMEGAPLRLTHASIQAEFVNPELHDTTITEIIGLSGNMVNGDDGPTRISMMMVNPAPMRGALFAGVPVLLKRCIDHPLNHIRVTVRTARVLHLAIPRYGTEHGRTDATLVHTVVHWIQQNCVGRPSLMKDFIPTLQEAKAYLKRSAVARVLACFVGGQAGASEVVELRNGADVRLTNTGHTLYVTAGFSEEPTRARTRELAERAMQIASEVVGNASSITFTFNNVNVFEIMNIMHRVVYKE